MTGLSKLCPELLSNTQKRFEDTTLILSEVLEWGLESERGRAAIRRMNQMHHRFAIANEDYLYVLSTTIFEPVRWIERYGWRPLTEHEKLALFYFARHLGRYMNIQNIPASYEEFEQFKRQYEQTNFEYAETNRLVAQNVLKTYLNYFPRWLGPFVKQEIYALLERPVLKALGFPQAAFGMRELIRGLYWWRGKLVGWFPARRQPRLLTQRQTASYPQGYQIEMLGSHSTKAG